MLAYYDSLSGGLIPCRVISADLDEGRLGRIVLEATAARGVYEPGNRIETTTIRAIPRNAVRGQRSIGGPRIYPYSWEERLGSRTYIR